MNNDEKTAIYEALICILNGMKFNSLSFYDDKFKEARNNYITSTIKMLEELKKNEENKK